MKSPKTIITIILLFAALALFTACGKDSTQTADNQALTKERQAKIAAHKADGDR